MVGREGRLKQGSFADWVAGYPAGSPGIINAVLRHVEAAVGMIEHAGVAEIGQRSCGRGLDRVAVGVVIGGLRRGRRAADNNGGFAHRAEPVEAVTELRA